MSTKQLNLKQKLIEIRKEIGILQKTEQGNRSKYINPATLLLRVTEAMNEYGILLQLQILEAKNTVEQINDKTVYITEHKMLYTWHDVDSSETMECLWAGVGKNIGDASMAGGSSLSYSERYFLTKFFQIPTTQEDPEFLKQKSLPDRKIDDHMHAELVAKLMEKKSVSGDMICDYYNIDNLEHLTFPQFKECLLKLAASE